MRSKPDATKGEAPTAGTRQGLMSQTPSESGFNRPNDSALPEFGKNVVMLPTAVASPVKQTRRGRLPKELHAFRDLRRAKFDALTPVQLAAERDRMVQQGAMREAERKAGAEAVQVLHLLRNASQATRTFVHGWLEADVDLSRRAAQ